MVYRRSPLGISLGFLVIHHMLFLERAVPYRVYFLCKERKISRNEDTLCLDVWSEIDSNCSHFPFLFTVFIIIGSMSSFRLDQGLVHPVLLLLLLECGC